MRASQILLSLAAALTTVSAQSSSTCNPTKQSCKPNPALGKTLAIDFRDGESDQFKAAHAGKKISYGKDGADFKIESKGDNPTLQSKFYIMYGHVEAMIKAAPGTGIVSSFVLQSDDLDEIDLEWLGGDTSQVQSNYFSKGDTSTYNRGQFHQIDSPQENFHNYTIEWNDKQTTWYVDGNEIRSLSADNDGGYPQTPMSIRIGSWAGGDPSNPEGTIQWAGGKTNYGDGPFDFYVKSLYVQDYSTGDEYVYKDKSGKADSIEAKGGKVNGNKDTDNEKLDKFHSEVSKSKSAPKSTKGSEESKTSSAASASVTTSGSASVSAASSGKDDSSNGLSSPNSTNHSGTRLSTAGASDDASSASASETGAAASSGGSSGSASASSSGSAASAAASGSSSASSSSMDQSDDAAILKAAWSLISLSSIAMALFL